MRALKLILAMFFILSAFNVAAVEYDLPETEDQTAEEDDARDQWAKLRQQPELTDKSGTRSEFGELVRAVTAKKRAALKDKSSTKTKKSSRKKEKTEKTEEGLKTPESTPSKEAQTKPPLGESKAKSPDGSTKSAF